MAARTHLCPDCLCELSQILRGRLGLVRVRRMAIDLRMRWMRPAMVRRDACGGRGLLMACHVGILRCRHVLSTVGATKAPRRTRWDMPSSYRTPQRQHKLSETKQVCVSKMQQMDAGWRKAHETRSSLGSQAWSKAGRWQRGRGWRGEGQQRAEGTRRRESVSRRQRADGIRIRQWRSSNKACRLRAQSGGGRVEVSSSLACKRGSERGRRWWERRAKKEGVWASPTLFPWAKRGLGFACAGLYGS